MIQERRQDLGPEQIAPTAALGEQRLQVVQDQNQRLLLEQGAQPRQSVLAEF